MTSTRSKAEHKQAPITYDGEVIFSVDKKLQKLIQHFVDNSIETINSCEDDIVGTCWIEFELRDWIGITESAFREEPHHFYEFIVETCDVTLHSQDDGSLDEKENEWIEGENLMWSASVRFPKELLPTFEKFIRATLSDISPA